MTASAIRGDREKCLQSGMNDYIAKPVRGQVLKEVLESYLQQRPVHSPNLEKDAAKIAQNAIMEAKDGTATGITVLNPAKKSRPHKHHHSSKGHRRSHSGAESAGSGSGLAEKERVATVIEEIEKESGKGESAVDGQEMSGDTTPKIPSGFT
jgi:hypothetical protein